MSGHFVVAPSSNQRHEMSAENAESRFALPEGFTDGIEVPDFEALAGASSIEVDPFTGAATGSLALGLSPGRSGFGPDLQLHYDSRAGNGHFGLGWSLGITSIGRNTRAGMPRHVDEDVFEIDDEELVPALRSSGGWMDERFSLGDYIITRYKRRFEHSFERIERWVHQPTSQVHWRIVDRHNVTSLFGTSDESRVSDPEDVHRVARWLLAERFDDRGNVIRYQYKPENLQGVDLDSPNQKHRSANPNLRGGERYLKRVLYGNVAPHDRGPWHFEAVFDYGEHDLEDPRVEEQHEWSVRLDAFSHHRAGFEVRAWRRCRRVLMFHRFDDLGPRPSLVSSISFEYDDSPSRATLVRAVRAGHIQREGKALQTKTLPPVTFGYTADGVDLVAREIDSGHLPAAMAGDSQARWVDFYEEGLPGLLTRNGDEWQFIRNLGNSRFAVPETVPYEDDTPVDLTKTDIVSTALAHERSYRPTTVMRGKASASQDDQHIGYIDLNGDSADDVIVADQEVLRWYPSQGEDGFADPIVLRLGKPGRVPSRRLTATDKQSFHLADMTGDGIYDLVRVRPTEISYWPGLGLGRFGERIVFDNAPDLTGTSMVQVMLADINGTGSTDVVRIDEGRVDYWQNRSGSSFGERHTAEAPGVNARSTPVAIDLFGTGSECIVWLDRSAGGARARYLAPKQQVPCGRLNRVDNGMGLSRRLSYVSSVDLWRRDRDANREWFFTSPVPIHVVERMEERDAIAGTRSMQRFIFRNAAYEDDEARFIGFATSERWNGGLTEDYALPGLFPDEAVPEIPENRRVSFTVEKSWFHTGSMVDGGDLTEELIGEFHTDSVTGRHRWLPGHIMPAGQDVKAAAEAYRTLRGWLLRRELIDAKTGTPVEVVERNAHVRQIQPSRGARPQVLDTQHHEQVTVHYDPTGTDPRIEHEIALNVDDFGFVSRRAHIVYARRDPEVDAQAADAVTIEDHEVAHGSTHATWYRLGVPVATSITSVVPGKRADGHLYDLKAVRQMAERNQGSLISRERNIYWSNDSRSLLPAGRIESRALLARVERLAFAPSVLEDATADRDTADMLRFEGGYMPDESGWWAPGETTSYDPAHFYVPSATRRAIGDETRLSYDASFLFPVAVEDVFGNVTRTKWNMRTLTWCRRTDPNGNVTTRRFDALGLPLAVIRSGRDEGDAAAQTIEASGKDDPTAVVTYRFPTRSKPGWLRIRHRLRHRVLPPPLFDYTLTFDGSGRNLAVATRSGVGKWLVRGLLERDGEGRITGEGAAFFSDTPLVDDVLRGQSLAQGRRYVLDVHGRAVRIDEPGGFIQTFQYTPWVETHHDASDNVLDSPWYAARQGSAHLRAGDFGTRRATLHVFEARAAAMAAVHAQTPTTCLLDPKGRTVAVRRRLSRNETLEERYELDAAGNVLAVIDASGREARSVDYDLLGRPYRFTSLDTSTSVHVLAASGELLRRRTPAGDVVRHRYDAAGRRTHTYVSVNEDDERLVERTIWAGGETNVPDAAKRNLIGHVHMHIGPAGLELTELRDMQGRPLRERLYESIQRSHDTDWMAVEELSHSGQVIELLRAKEGQESIVEQPESIECRYDALGNLLSTRSGDLMLGFRYGAQARLDGARVLVRGRKDRQTVIDGLRYDASGRLAAGALGESVRLRRRYDDAGRVVELAASSRAVEGRVQDRHLVYGPDANVVSINDKGELTASYAYDALGRLVRAEGFAPGPVDDESKTVGGVRRFTNAYKLDATGNIESIDHTSTGADYQRMFSYEESSNRVLAAGRPERKPEGIAASFTYDVWGNVVTGPDDHSYKWDHDGRMVEATVGGTRVFYAYASDGQLMRRLAAKPGGVIEEMLRWRNVLRCRKWIDGDLVEDVKRHEVSVGDDPLVVLGLDGGSLDVTNVLTDQLGSAMVELNGAGAVVADWEFLPYGTRWSRTQGLGTDDGGVRAHDFRDGWYDGDIGLLFLDGRWYSPWLGRFVSTYGSDEANPYVVASGNPQSVN